MISPWPELSYAEQKETCETLHLWLQVLGKIKLAKLPWVNHSWHVALTVTAQGITTGNIPHDQDHVQLDLDLVAHQLVLLTSSGRTERFGLAGNSVADFYNTTMALLAGSGIRVRIHRTPNEIPDAIPFDRDHLHAIYVPEDAARMHRALLKATDVLTRFRAEFLGKCSPVHLFWGAFDLAVTRFSGRTAPPHPGGVPNLPDRVAREAYSHEVSSCGFWFGDDRVPFASFYAYFYPEPEGFRDARPEPDAAYYDGNLGEFLLPYDEVRRSPNPEATLLAFLRSTYTAGARLAHWSRAELERSADTT